MRVAGRSGDRPDRRATVSVSQPEPSEAPPTSKTAYVLERLRREIANGAIRPGEPLRQADLARRFGVSPTPVREALRLLEAEGTISYSPHRGASVTELSPEHVRDLYLLRAAVEGLGTRLAVERMDDQTLAEIRDLHERLAGAADEEDKQRLATWNRELHLRICQASSPLIASQATALWRMFPPRVTLWQDADNAREFNDQHRAIIDVMAEGDAAGAEALMVEHILTAGRHRHGLAAAGRDA
jgi:DNA-binding GntR family transcriptional regulator